ncbi:MAG TPA: PhoH family protein [Stellaceae bacterium]|nr:PhoH family protein [Stellaceae bacterium]
MAVTVPTDGPVPNAEQAQMAFADNALLALLAGERDQHLKQIERQLGVTLALRGNRLVLSGSAAAIDTARIVLQALYDRLRRGLQVDRSEVDAALRLTAPPPRAGDPPAVAESPAIRTRKRQITARSIGQRAYIKALLEHELVFGVGPAGTGKTYLAVAVAVDMMMSGQVQRIILSRPAVEAGERLGFLPGDLKDKVDPYLRPLYDALNDMLPGDQVVKRLATGDIEVAPLAFMRGRTLSNAFVILDEAQNTTPVQMKMLLTRLGENSRMAITGDLSQIDLPRGTRSGLADALDIVEEVEGIAVVRFDDGDVVRHPLVQRLVRAYDAADRRRRVDQDLPGQDLPTQHLPDQRPEDAS